MEIVDPRQDLEFITAEDQEKPENERTTFLFRPLTGLNFVKIQQCLSEIERKCEAEKREMETYEQAELGMMALRMTLSGWRNLTATGANGQRRQIKFSSDLVERLPLGLLTELGQFAFTTASIGVKEEGELDSRSE